MVAKCLITCTCFRSPRLDQRPRHELTSPKDEAASSAPASAAGLPPKLPEEVIIAQIPSIEERYTLEEKLGSGGFGTVNCCTAKSDNSKYAIKIVPRKIAMESRGILLREVGIMSKLKHENIVELHDVFETPEAFCIVMELMRGGELFDRIVSKGTFTESDAASVISQIFRALAYIHKKGCVHCDLKPENLVYSTPDDGSHIKIIDFGLAQTIDFSPEKNKKSEVVGTPEYMAPEMLNEAGNSPTVDCWAMGVITYVLLSGYFPFYGDSVTEIFARIYKGKFKFPDEEWKGISDTGKDFISKLLEVDISKRLTADMALEHPWLKGSAPAVALPPTNIERLKAFNYRRKWKAAILTAKAAARLAGVAAMVAKKREAAGPSNGSTLPTPTATVASPPAELPVPPPGIEPDEVLLETTDDVAALPIKNVPLAQRASKFFKGLTANKDDEVVGVTPTEEDLEKPAPMKKRQSTLGKIAFNPKVVQQRVLVNQ